MSQLHQYASFAFQWKIRGICNITVNINISTNTLMLSINEDCAQLFYWLTRKNHTSKSIQHTLQVKKYMLKYSQLQWFKKNCLGIGDHGLNFSLTIYRDPRKFSLYITCQKIYVHNYPNFHDLKKTLGEHGLCFSLNTLKQY